MIDRKMEPLVKRLMVKYLGELEDDDLIMFVLEHLKDHKSPSTRMYWLWHLAWVRPLLVHRELVIRGAPLQS